MTLYNNTPNQVFYTIAGAGSVDCGTIDSGQPADFPFFDNQSNISVSFAPPNENSSFSVTIPESGTGKAVTIGIYLE